MIRGQKESQVTKQDVIIILDPVYVESRLKPIWMTLSKVLQLITSFGLQPLTLVLSKQEIDLLKQGHNMLGNKREEIVVFRLSYHTQGHVLMFSQIHSLTFCISALDVTSITPAGSL